MDPWLSSRYGGVTPDEQATYKVRRVEPPRVTRRAARQAEQLMMRELPRARVRSRTRAWAWFLLGVEVGAGVVFWLGRVGLL